MTFRSRLLATFVTLVLVPLGVLAIGVRRETGRRLTAEYDARVAGLVAVIRQDLRRESASLAAGLSRLVADAAQDNRLRAALQERGAGTDRGYLLDYAGRAMRRLGLDMLQLQDDAGRIVSSGQFRNEFDRSDPGLPRGLAEAPGGMALVLVRAPDTSFLALARVDSLRLAGRRFTVAGGRGVGPEFLRRLARDRSLAVRLEYPGGTLGDSGTSGAVVSGALPLPFVGGGEARVVVTADVGPLAALQRSLDRWFVVAVAVTAAAALLWAGWLSSRLSRPLTALADKTAALDLDRFDVDFATDRQDELGALSRLLAALTQRLRVGTAKLREAERRIAVGEVARQVNHDVKNGLIPVRNVLRHMAEVAERDPDRLAAVFRERRGTLDSGIGYLETLAANYARLSPKLDGRTCDVNAVVAEVAGAAPRRDGLQVTLRLADALPQVAGDAVVVRRVLENLVGNAVDSLGAAAGTVTVATESVGDGGRPGVRLTVADTGPGMSHAELDRAFEDFYTTKPGGTGLGLSIVRRLVLDLSGTLRVETAPGKGTSFVIDLPAARGGRDGV